MLLQMRAPTSFHRPLLLLCVALWIPIASNAQADSAPPPASAGPSPTETPQQLRDRLSAGQKQQFDDAIAAFNAKRYADALVLLNPLRDRHPRDPILAKYVSEASVNTGDDASAITTLKPLLQADPNDWQATGILARACAETGDAACRDTEMAHLSDLHRQGIMPPGMKEYTIEQVKSGANTVRISMYLEPFGMYKIYSIADVFNADGKLFLTITIESNDIDQPAFAKEHPKEAAAGARRFSLDAYAETGTNQQGKRTQTHYTFAFLDGQPTYAELREKFLNIAAGKGSPMSSRSGLIVP